MYAKRVCDANANPVAAGGLGDQSWNVLRRVAPRGQQVGHGNDVVGARLHTCHHSFINGRWRKLHVRDFYDEVWLEPANQLSHFGQVSVRGGLSGTVVDEENRGAHGRPYQVPMAGCPEPEAPVDGGGAAVRLCSHRSAETGATVATRPCTSAQLRQAVRYS